MIVPSENFTSMYPFKNLMYTREKSLASSFETARSAHVPLKILHKRKILTHYFHV